MGKLLGYVAKLFVSSKGLTVVGKAAAGYVAAGAVVGFDEVNTTLKTVKDGLKKGIHGVNDLTAGVRDDEPTDDKTPKNDPKKEKDIKRETDKNGNVTYSTDTKSTTPEKEPKIETPEPAKKKWWEKGLELLGINGDDSNVTKALKGAAGIAGGFGASKLLGGLTKGAGAAIGGSGIGGSLVSGLLTLVVAALAVFATVKLVDTFSGHHKEKDKDEPLASAKDLPSKEKLLQVQKNAPGQQQTTTVTTSQTDDLSSTMSVNGQGQLVDASELANVGTHLSTNLTGPSINSHDSTTKHTDLVTKKNVPEPEKDPLKKTPFVDPNDKSAIAKLDRQAIKGEHTTVLH